MMQEMLVRKPKPMWLVECSWPVGEWTLVAVPQSAAVCPRRCKKTIFDNLEHRA